MLVRLGVPPRTPEDLHAEDVERRQVRTVLAALARRQATILLMWAEDLSYAEIAAAAGIQPSSVVTW